MLRRVGRCCSSKATCLQIESEVQDVLQMHRTQMRQADGRGGCAVAVAMPAQPHTASVNVAACAIPQVDSSKVATTKLLAAMLKRICTTQSSSRPPARVSKHTTIDSKRFATLHAVSTTLEAALSCRGCSNIVIRLAACKSDALTLARLRSLGRCFGRLARSRNAGNLRSLQKGAV